MFYKEIIQTIGSKILLSAKFLKLLTQFRLLTQTLPIVFYALLGKLNAITLVVAGGCCYIYKLCDFALLVTFTNQFVNENKL